MYAARIPALALAFALTALCATAHGAPAKMTVAVLPFDNTADPDDGEGLGRGLQSLLTTDLSQLPSLQLVERDRLADIREEIARGHSDAFDSASAARIGKLLGASHLLAGTVTIHAGRMRIDARLFEVETGKVLFGEASEGDAEAFFELEKELVGRLVRALALKPPARVRAELMRIHTADLEAFKSFGQGVGLFDAKRYDEAVAKLRAATERDARFELARLTLAEYQRLISQLHTRADALETARRELARAQADRQQAEESAIIGRLFEIVEREGPARGRARFLTALHTLAMSYAARSARALERGDQFAVERTTDLLFARWWREAAELFPTVLPHPSRYFFGGFPNSPDDLEPDLRVNAAILLDADISRYQRARGADKRVPVPRSAPPKYAKVVKRDTVGEKRRYLYKRFLGVDKNERALDTTLAQRLWLDRAGEARFHAQLVDQWLRLEPGPGGPRKMRLVGVAELFRSVLDLGESTAWFVRMQGMSDDPAVVRSAAEGIERNRQLEALLADAGRGGLVREYLRLALPGRFTRPDSVLKTAREVFLADDAGVKALERINGQRCLRRLRDAYRVGDFGPYLLVGKTADARPLWFLQGTNHINTGPRPDFLRTRSLHYHRRKADPKDDALIVGGRQPAAELDVRFTLLREPPGGWHPTWRFGSSSSGSRKGERWEGAPTVGVLFGLRDVHVPRQQTAERGRRELVQPLTGFMLAISSDEIRLVEIVEEDRDHRNRRIDEARVVGRTKLTGASDRANVRVRVRGGKVTGRVGDTRFSFALPGERPDETAHGWSGFLLRDAGYVGLQKISYRDGK